MNKPKQDPIRLKEVFFTASVLFLLSVLFFNNHIQQFPSHIHAWTQSDRYALSLGFVENDLDLFHPATLNLHPKYEPQEKLVEEKGITRVDLPLPDYLAAIIMTITGNQKPVVFRLVTLLIGLAGLLYLFAMMRSIGSGFSIALFSTVFVFSSPVFTYYLDGFIPSIPAISISFAAFYYYCKYLRYNIFRDFILTLILLTIAALIRMPFILPLLAVAAVQFIFSFRKKEILIREMLSILFFISIFSAYYTYNQYLGKVYGSLFLNQLMPARSLKELSQLILLTLANWKFHYFSVTQHLVILAGIVLLTTTLIRKKLSDKVLIKLLLVSGIIFLAGIAYFVLMAQQFPAHDYYFLDIFYLPVFFIALAGLSSIRFRQKKTMIFGNILLFLLGITMLFSSYQTQNERYTTKGWDRTEITTKNFTGGSDLCSQASISADAKVLVIDAYTYNIPLILLNRKGYAVLNTSESEIEKSLHYDFDFIAIQNRFLSGDVLRNFPQLRSRLKPFANNGKIGFYHLTDLPGQQPFVDLIGLPHQKIIYSNEKQSVTGIFQKSDKAFFTVIDTILTMQFSDSLLLVFESLATLSEKSKGGLHFVMDLSNPLNDQQFKFYDSFQLDSYFEEKNMQAKIEVTLNIPKIEQKNVRFKCYIWNQGHNNLVYNNMKLQIVQYIKHTF